MKLDIDLSFWDIKEDITVLCMSIRLDNCYDRNLGSVLQSFDDEVANNAVLNWRGVDYSKGSHRVCTPVPTPVNQWKSQ